MTGPSAEFAAPSAPPHVESGGRPAGLVSVEEVAPRVRLYQDRDDWWVGYYRGPNHHYVCPLPTLVIRWRRRVPPGSPA